MQPEPRQPEPGRQDLASREDPATAVPPAAIAEDVAVYEAKLEAYRRGEVDDAVFKPFRLHYGVYGQRQGGENQMIRVKIPYGGVTSEQLRTIGDLAEEHGTGVGHVTTRQDVQIHFVQLPRTAAVLRRLAAAGLTTREACGNSVRNVCACPVAGVCTGEAFDVTPYAKALSDFLLRHPASQKLPRKFKINFSGCVHECGQGAINCIGWSARVGAAGERGWQVRVGGGLGASPHAAPVLYEFLPVGEMLEVAEAIVRVFDREGDRTNRNKARLKFVVERLGIDRFREEVEREREAVRGGPRLKEWVDLAAYDARLAEDGAPANGAHGAAPGVAAAPGAVRWAQLSPAPAALSTAGAPLPAVDDPAAAAWMARSVFPQKQQGHVWARVWVPLGDLTRAQLHGLADLADRFALGRVRLTNDQNVVLRWLRPADLPAIHAALAALGLGGSRGGTIADVTSCPGTTTCQLGITSSKGMGGHLTEFLAEHAEELAPLQDVSVKMSGCPNSCGQHHVAAVGFYGCTIKKDGRALPAYLLLLGGGIDGEGAHMGRTMVKVPARRAPEAILRLARVYASDAEPGETFQSFSRRVERKRVREALADLLEPASYEEDATLYRDFGETTDYTLEGMGPGECAV